MGGPGRDPPRGAPHEAPIRYTLAFEVVDQWRPTTTVTYPRAAAFAMSRDARYLAGYGRASATGTDRELVVPLRSGGQKLGVIVIQPKVDGALFTDEELRLVQTIAGLGALAIHNALVLSELETRRALELAATRGDPMTWHLEPG